MVMDRRKLITIGACLIAAPAIVRYEWLMPVKKVIVAGRHEVDCRGTNCDALFRVKCPYDPLPVKWGGSQNDAVSVGDIFTSNGQQYIITGVRSGGTDYYTEKWYG